jgi:hypothetical protein
MGLTYTQPLHPKTTSEAIAVDRIWTMNRTAFPPEGERNVEITRTLFTQVTQLLTNISYNVPSEPSSHLVELNISWLCLPPHQAEDFPRDPFFPLIPHQPAL